MTGKALTVVMLRQRTSWHLLYLPTVAGAVDTYLPCGLLSSLPESPASHPSLAATPTGSSSSSGPPGDWAQESPLPASESDLMRTGTPSTAKAYLESGLGPYTLFTFSGSASSVGDWRQRSLNHEKTHLAFAADLVI